MVRAHGICINMQGNSPGDIVQHHTILHLLEGAGAWVCGCYNWSPCKQSAPTSISGAVYKGAEGGQEKKSNFMMGLNCW